MSSLSALKKRLFDRKKLKKIFVGTAFYVHLIIIRTTDSSKYNI